jgi:protoheme IX farnesyltransferase
MPDSHSASPLLVARPYPTRAALAGALLALTKPRIGLASAITTMAAYAAARPPANIALALVTSPAPPWPPAAHCRSTSGGRRTDALMRRTRDRPLPQALLSAHAALALEHRARHQRSRVAGGGCQSHRGRIAAGTVILYGLICAAETPHPVGHGSRAISGALPAFSAAPRPATSAPLRESLSLPCCSSGRCRIFFAIGWWHRADYRAAGSRLLPAIDPTGAKTGAWSFVYTVILIAVSLAPWALGWFGPIYGVNVTLAGAGFIWFAWRFASALDERDQSAQRLFVASIVYLPVVTGAVLFDRYCAV